MEVSGYFRCKFTLVILDLQNIVASSKYYSDRKNDAWLKSHVEDTREYANKSELVNDLIRRARRAEEINQKLVTAEMGGFIEQSPEDMLREFKAELKR